MVFSQREVNSELEKCFLRSSLNEFQLHLYDNKNKNGEKNFLKPKSEKNVCSKQEASKREHKSNHNFKKCIPVYLRTLKRGTKVNTAPKFESKYTHTTH